MKKFKSKIRIHHIPKRKHYALFTVISILLLFTVLFPFYRQSLSLIVQARSNTINVHITPFSNARVGQDIEIILTTDTKGDVYRFDLDCGNGKKGKQKQGEEVTVQRQEFICRYDKKGTYILRAQVNVQTKYFNQSTSSIPVTYGLVVFDTSCGSYSQMCCGDDSEPTSERCVSGVCTMGVFPVCGKGKVSLGFKGTAIQKGYAEVNTAIPVSLDTTVLTDRYNYYLDCNTDGRYEFTKENVPYNGYFGNAKTGDFTCIYKNPGTYTVSGYVSILDGSGNIVKLIPPSQTIEVREQK